MDPDTGQILSQEWKIAVTADGHRKCYDTKGNVEFLIQEYSWDKLHASWKGGKVPWTHDKMFLCFRGFARPASVGGESVGSAYVEIDTSIEDPLKQMKYSEFPFPTIGPADQ